MTRRSLWVSNTTTNERQPSIQRVTNNNIANNVIIMKRKRKTRQIVTGIECNISRMFHNLKIPMFLIFLAGLYRNSEPFNYHVSKIFSPNTSLPLFVEWWQCIFSDFSVSQFVMMIKTGACSAHSYCLGLHRVISLSLNLGRVSQ